MLQRSHVGAAPTLRTALLPGGTADQHRPFLGKGCVMCHEE